MRLLFFLLLTTGFCRAYAIQKTWIGNPGDNWTNSNSWSPAGVPGTTDDIYFNSSTTVQFTSNVTGIRSLHITGEIVVLFEATGAFKLGSSVGAPVTIAAGATLQIRGINNASAGLSLELDGTSVIDGTLELLAGTNSKASLYSGIATTANLTVTGTIRTGFQLIGSANADAGSLESFSSAVPVTFASGSLYEIARTGGIVTIPKATWATDATLLISGAQSVSGLQLAWAGATAHELGTLIWNCPSQGGIGSLAVNSFPYLNRIKGNFQILHSNGKIVRFANSTSTSYTLTFDGDFVISHALVIPELMSSTAASGTAAATLVFKKNVAVLPALRAGNTSSTAHLLRFEGSSTGTGGFGPQDLNLAGGVQPADVFSLTVNNAGNGVQLASSLGILRNITLTNGLLYLGNYSITAGGGGGTITSGATGWVVTDGTGSLRLAIAAGQGRVFPVAVGESGMDRVGITPVAADTFAVRVSNVFSHAVADASKVYNREWEISSQSTSAIVELAPDPVNATPPATSGIQVIGHYKNGAWTETESTGTGTLLSSAFTANFTSFSPFGAGIKTGFTTFSSTVYTFTGNGNWSNAANWQNNLVPPASLTPGSAIYIDPQVNGSCLLDIPYTVAPGASLTVISGKKFEVNGNLTIQ